jgi:hypothetical protein
MAPVPTVIVDKPILVCCISTYGFSPGTLVYSTNKTDHHDITEINGALNSKTPKTYRDLILIRLNWNILSMLDLILTYVLHSYKPSTNTAWVRARASH